MQKHKIALNLSPEPSDINHSKWTFIALNQKKSIIQQILAFKLPTLSNFLSISSCQKTVSILNISNIFAYSSSFCQNCNAHNTAPDKMSCLYFGSAINTEYFFPSGMLCSCHNNRFALQAIV